ncbi:neurogenic locus notch homolog protein-like [Antedon mediterranea]|uniref:neurogenic locus notch homolog protein-like n=1 Tax=Antedon mediterranea TaxID=105859 RepID=UPI003AF4461E
MYLKIVFSLLTVGTVGAVLEAVRPPQHPCLYNLCMARSTCIPDNSDPKGYFCECTNCYGGEFCDKAKLVSNLCWIDGNHCLNGGYCDFTDCTLSCVCPSGFTGDKCQNEPPVNPCVSGEHQCQNGATCIPDKVGLGYFCQCTNCYEGKFCESSAEEVYNPCADINNSPCLFGGVCDFTDCTFRCICKPGYSGIVCENEPPVDACTSGEHNCPKGATCVPDKLGPGYFCQCKSAKPVANPCSSDNSPCYNGGVCDFSGCTFSCRCPPNFIGELCQYPQCPKGVEVVSCLINPCVFATCPANQNAQCRANYCGGCNAVFYDSNGVEVDCVHPCNSGEHQCQNGATCIPDTVGLGYSCECTNCFGGEFCQFAKPVANPCLRNDNPCYNGGTCDFPDCTLRCRCPPGFTGDLCQYVECPTSTPCLTAKCAHGFIVDTNGCQTCNCLPGPKPCPQDVQVYNCFVNPCDTAVCPANSDAICIANYCGGCNAVFYDTSGVEVNCAVVCKKIGCANPCPFGSETDANGCPTCRCLPNPAPCPKGKKPSKCKKNPCDGTTCEVNPMTACVPNYCGGCSADFYDHNLNIDQECLQANCPQIRCANPCPFGTEVTSEGCPTCTCLPNPAPCPNGRPPFACKRNPCDGTTCSVNPMTSCVPNYCGGCFVDFYDRNLNIDEECLETNCHGDLVFSDCASACPPTCKNPDIVCKALCRPGCTCPKGKVLTRFHSKRCVRPSNCKCVGLKGYLGECRITPDEQ